jgi:uncharacterized protein (TIGR02145 family)
MEIKMIVCAATVRDIDGNVYQGVKIGTQIWTTENLRVTRFNDGSVIPHIRDSTLWRSNRTGAYQYHYNSANIDTFKKYGAKYNWYTVGTNKLAPVGWHVPTDGEWRTLVNYMIQNGYNSRTDDVPEGNSLAKALAAKTDSTGYYYLEGSIGKDMSKNNKSGFSALNCGDLPNKWNNRYYYSIWWTSTEYGIGTDYAKCWILYDQYYHIGSNDHGKIAGQSVRLVKDLAWELQGVKGDSISINDSLTVLANYSNISRKITTIQWYIGSTFLFKTKSGTDLVADTLKYAWATASSQMVYIALTDEKGTITLDSMHIKVYKKEPIDPKPTIVDQWTVINAPLSLTGRVDAKFGTIKKYEWDFGNTGTFIQTSTADTVINSPSSQNMKYQCVFRVTAVDGNTKTDTINVSVYHDTVTDVDGNVYRALLYGNKVWMVENLKVTRYNDGKPLDYGADYRWYNNDSTNNFGAFYNCYLTSTKYALNFAPSGWHVPSSQEWDTLVECLVANGYNWDGSTINNKIGKALASQKNWDVLPIWLSQDCQGCVGNDLSKNNSSGFNAQPAGSLVRGATDLELLWSGIYKEAVWWSSTVPYGYISWPIRTIKHNADLLQRDKSGYQVEMHTVRCVKD